MKQTLIILLLLSFALGSAQQALIGRVSVEGDRSVQGVSVFNATTESLTQTDKDGHFLIFASVGDEIRFAKRGFQRVSYRVNGVSFSASVSITLPLAEYEIEEVVVGGFRPTGNIQKDTRALDRPLRERKLNDEMSVYAMTPPKTGAYPSSPLPSTLQTGPNFQAGQMDLLKLASGLAGLVGSVSAPPPPNYAQREAFFKRLKQAIDLNFYYKYGMDEYEFDIFLAHADDRLDLVKNYRYKFNAQVIEAQLKGLLKGYLDQRVLVQKQKVPS